MKHYVVPEHSGLQSFTHSPKISLDKFLDFTAAALGKKVLDDLRIQLGGIHCLQPVLSL